MKKKHCVFCKRLCSCSSILRVKGMNFCFDCVKLSSQMVREGKPEKAPLYDFVVLGKKSKYTDEKQLLI